MQIIRVLSFLSVCFSVMMFVVTTLRDHILPPELPPAVINQTVVQQNAANDNAPQISVQRIRHILYGDRTGGGHLYGVNAPCKSEFPPEWNEEEIIATVKTLAANDNMKWQREENGYYTAEQKVEGVRVRVVLDREKDDIVTAYPTNRPRNPCPSR